MSFNGSTSASIPRPPRATFAAVLAANSAPLPLPSPAPVAMLVVDSSGASRRMHQMLEDLGYVVVFHSSAGSALRNLTDVQPDFVVLDCWNDEVGPATFLQIAQWDERDIARRTILVQPAGTWVGVSKILRRHVLRGVFPEQEGTGRLSELLGRRA